MSGTPSSIGGSSTLRLEVGDGVGTITLTRPGEHNTITPELREDLLAALDTAERSPEVRVILLLAEGPAFCSGYRIDRFLEVQEAETEPPGRRWDSVADLHFMRPYVDAFLRLWNHPKPTVAGVQGWCIGGGSDMVMCADLVMAGEGAVFGYPPVRVWGMPTTPMWIHRLGTQYAKRYLLTGDEIPAATAERIGLTFETVPDDELHDRARAFARRMALLPLNQLMMVKMYCNQVVDSTGVQPQTSFSTILDGIARHTQEGVDFAARADEVGFRQAVRDRDDPFGDYGSRPRPERP